MPRKFFRKYLPDHASIREHRYLKRVQPLLKHPNLWHLNRHSVAGGVAAGLFAGLIPGPVQMLSGALLAIVFRVNLPVAMFTTLYTNPFTWGPLIVAAYAIGAPFTGETMANAIPPEFNWSGGHWLNYVPELWQWFKELGETYLIGSLILGLSLAALGYATVQIAWRLYLLAYLRRRSRRRRG
jgi:uncharacterized protein